MIEPLSREFFRSRSVEDEASGCWVWQKATARNGYGVLRKFGRSWRAHRLSFIVAKSCDDPVGMDVCHRGDNRACVNPDHLFLGSRADNMRDCADKGRIRVPALAGEDCPAAKLSLSQVIAIRSDPRSQRALARAYGVDKGTIAGIKNGKTWRSV